MNTNKNIPVDFSHQLEGENDGSLLFFYESLNASLERAAAITDILGSI
jgi:hypothetical protein